MTVSYYRNDDVVIINGYVVADLRSVEIPEIILSSVSDFVADFYEEIKDRVAVKLADLTVHRDVSEEMMFCIGWKGFPFGLRSAACDFSPLLDESDPDDGEASGR